MKLAALLLIFSVAHIASAVPVLEKSDDYPRFIEIPGGDGLMHKVDLEAEPDMAVVEDINRNADNNAYLLYTRRNPRLSQTLIINNAGSVTRSNFNPSLPVVVCVHGWLGSQYNDINPTVREAVLGRDDVNYIFLDWRRAALYDYATSVRLVPGIGRGLGDFLAFLNSATGVPFTNMHLVGFSLGAHVVGNAGRRLNGRVARVTGLDPAGPLWVYNSDRLGPNDGVYVEAIHTDGGTAGLGIGRAIANVDFFPNGGNSQPGCIYSLCNHEFAWKLFASTVTNNHLVGNECTTTLQITWNTCRGQRLNMGNNDLRKTGSGMYRVDTNWRYPY